MNWPQIIQLGASLGAAVFLGVLVFGNYKRGDSQAAKEALELREKQVQALKESIDENKKESKEREDKMAEKINELTGKVGELTGLITSKDGEIKRLNEILTNRNPEMETFFKQVTSVTDTLPKLLIIMEKLDTHISQHKD